MSRSPATAWRRVPLMPRARLDPTSGRAGRSIAALTGSSDWRRVAGDMLGGLAVAVIGAGSLPVGDEPQWPDMPIADLAAHLAAEQPGLHHIGAIIPRQHGRPRLSMLGRMTGNLVVVKLGAPDAGIETEAAALELLARRPLPGIATPRPLAQGTLQVDHATIAFLITSAVSPRRQRPAFDVPLRTFESDLGARLGALPRPSGTPPDAVPVHGDMAPYNLRRTPTGLALFDWEEAGWGTPGSDVATYRAVCDQIRRGRSRAHRAEDAS